MKCSRYLIIFALSLFFVFPVAAQSFNEVFVDSDRLTYQGYEVTKHYNPRTRLSGATIKKDGTLLARLNYGSGVMERNATRLGLISLLGAGRKQLVIEQNTGGANCCDLYWIYDFSPTFRLIYPGLGYDVHNGVAAEDIDGDGIYELVASVESFNYFGGMGHANSPFPSVVFKYDSSARRYRPVSKTFSSYLLKGIQGDIKKAQDVNAELASTKHEDHSGNYLGAMLNVVLKYIYAGKKSEGWAFYDREYKLNDKAVMRTKINGRLRQSVIYNSLYMWGNGSGEK